MATATQPLTPEMRRLLSALRMRIRLYVWLEGLALAVIWLGATFWIGLGIDYGLVRIGAGELPVAIRVVFLAVIAVVLLFILYRYILRRAFVPLANHSMALLMERKFSSFDDSLVTAVELNEHRRADDHYSDDMIADILTQAQHELGEVRLRKIFNWGPLLRNLLIAAVFIAVTLGFFVRNESAFNLWAGRLYALNDSTWPRQALIEIVDVQVSYGEPADAESTTMTAEFDGGHSLKTARGASLTLRVRANAEAPVVPRTCTIFYTNAEGERGRANMRKIGNVRDGYQLYSFEDKPFRAIISDLQFDVLGYDHRLRDYSIRVVDGPELSNIELDCTFPEYLVNERLSLWLPRTENYRNGIQLPRGTGITLRAAANKPIVSATIVNTVTEETDVIAFGAEGAESVAYEIPSLEEDAMLSITLNDIDGVGSREPHKIFIVAVEDRPPEVDIRLRGVSTAITPDARIPIEGTISDDYATERAWAEVFPSGGIEEEQSVTIGPGGEITAAVDLRDMRARDERPLALQPGDKLTLTIKASDKYNLSLDKNVGAGDRYQLDVVTPDELLNMLDTRELGLRRRFEQIIEEITLTRDSLVRVQNELTGAVDRGLEPEDVNPDDEPSADESANNSAADGDELPDDEAIRELRLRLLRVDRAIQQSQKATQEVLGVAVSFEDIREELINNRVDSEERKLRLEEQIAQPLRSIVENNFPRFEERLDALRVELNDGTETAAETANSAVNEANELVAEMESVLQRMLDLETYNELIDIVRSLLEDQEGLIEATKKEQADDILDLLQ